MTRPDAEPDELAARLLELSADDLLNVVGRAEEIWCRSTARNTFGLRDAVHGWC